jgi:hypothetical protein
MNYEENERQYVLVMAGGTSLFTDGQHFAKMIPNTGCDGRNLCVIELPAKGGNGQARGSRSVATVCAPCKITGNALAGPLR